MDAVAPTVSQRRRRWPWIVAALLLLLTAFVLLFDWSWLKGPIERRVAAATGRDFSIGGAFDVDFGLKPKVSASDVRLGNAQWSQHKEMAALERVEFRIALLPLLRGRIDLPYVHVDRPRLLIERNRDGQGNWQFSPEQQEQQPAERKRGRAPLIRDLTVNDGELRVLEPVLQTNLRLTLNSGKRSERQGRAPLLAVGEGTYRGAPFKFDGRVDSPLDLQNSERPFHVDVRASAGDTRVHASGALLAPLQFEDFELQFSMSGANLADLYELLGIALPQTPPYSLEGQLRRDAQTWSYRKFNGKVGDSDLAGDVAIDMGGERLLLKGDMTSKLLDFDDLAGLVGAPPSTRQGETASAEQRAEAERRRANPRVLPDTPYELEKLRVMDADVKLRAARIEAPKLPLEQMSVRVLLEDGLLKLDPLDFKVAGGTIASHVSMDARQNSIQTTATADVRGLHLGKMFPKVEIMKKGAGVLSGALAVTAQGNSIAHMAGSSSGNLGLIMGPGRVSNLLIELAGLDIAESLKYLLDEDRQIPLRCAYADFKIEDGVMHTQALVFDTTDTVIFGQGKIDSRTEELDLRLMPHPKDVSPLSARVPLRIGGTFKDPSFRPEAGALLLRGAAAAALYSLAPPAALLALIETGPGESVDCGPAGSHSS